MSQRRTERLLNLVVCLLSTTQGMSVRQIHERVPGYDEAESEEAFRRMFERDKKELRELGIPLESASESAQNDDYTYRIARRDYELPAIALAPDEAAAVGLASRLWQSAPLAGATGNAVQKLRAAGMEAPATLGSLEPRIGGMEPAFEACLAAARDARPVRFNYRTLGRSLPADRDVEPWGVVSRRGHWYLVGHDLVRGATRVFRVSRIVGTVTAYGEPGSVRRPEGVNLREMVTVSVQEAPTSRARVRVRKGTCGDLRHAAVSVSELEDGAELLVLEYGDPERLASRIAGYATDAKVVEPGEVRDAVIRRLQAAAGEAH